MSSSTETLRALEEQLAEAGNNLLQPPSSLDELLSLLDQVENLLSKVEQSPAKSTHAALSSLMKALVADKLLRHTDTNVKVGVASCISEITRITAPDAPYDDDKMKDVFQLIVSAFENLSDTSSRSYKKRALILETVAKVRSCVIMLDLECNELLIEMFQIFFKTISDDHPPSIFASMEAIICLVLDESEDVPAELLMTLLSSLKRDNQEVSAVARRLGERVLEICARKLKPYLMQASKSLDISLDNYSRIVSSICEGTVGQNNDISASEQLEAKDNAEGVCWEDAALSEDNGISHSRKEKASARVEFRERGENLDTDNTTISEETPKPESDDAEVEKSNVSKSKPEQNSKQRGCTLNSLAESLESAEPSLVDGEKGTEKPPDTMGSHINDSDSSTNDDTFPEKVKKFVKEKKISETKSHEDANVTPLYSNEVLVDEILPQKGGCPKEKESSCQVDIPSPKGVALMASDRIRGAEAKPKKLSVKKALREASFNEKTSGEVGTSRSEDGTTDSELIPQKQQIKKLDVSDSDEDGSAIKKKDMKKHGKVSAKKNATKSSSKDDEVVSSQKSRVNSAKAEDYEDNIHTKQKRATGKEKASETVYYGKNLVGSKVKVWWPKDRMFYEGVVESFHPVKNKHKVSYNDGDEEILNLRKERWELIEDDLATDAEDEAEPPITDVSSDMHKKKKARKDADSSMKHESDVISLKRSPSASSSKVKGSASKSGKKGKDGRKVDPDSRDGTSRSGGISKDETVNKSNVHSKKLSGSSVKDIDSNTPKSKSKQDHTKAASKSEEDTPKTIVKPKGKSTQSGNKSSSNGVGKVKPGSSKVKDGVNVKEKLNDSTKVPEGTKRKLSDLARDREGESKSEKKLKRSADG